VLEFLYSVWVSGGQGGNSGGNDRRTFEMGSSFSVHQLISDVLGEDGNLFTRFTSLSRTEQKNVWRAMLPYALRARKHGIEPATVGILS